MKLIRLTVITGSSIILTYWILRVVGYIITGGF